MTTNAVKSHDFWWIIAVVVRPEPVVIQHQTAALTQAIADAFTKSIRRGRGGFIVARSIVDAGLWIVIGSLRICTAFLSKGSMTDKQSRTKEQCTHNGWISMVKDITNLS